MDDMSIMQVAMKCAADLIALWGSRKTLAGDLGVDVERVHKWALRDNIPPAFDVRIVAAAARRGLAGVDFETMAHLRAQDDAA